TGEQGRDEKPDLAAAQLGKRDGAKAAALVGHALLYLALPDGGDGQAQVAVPVESVPGEVKMGIDDQQAVSGRHLPGCPFSAAGSGGGGRSGEGVICSTSGKGLTNIFSPVFAGNLRHYNLHTPRVVRSRPRRKEQRCVRSRLVKRLKP